MRRGQKEQAERVVAALARAHEKIKYCMEKHDGAAAMLLLESCQEGAIDLGTSIEEWEGENVKTIALLEEYCELVYQIHEEIAKGNAANAGRAYKNLKQQMTKISNSIRNDIPVRMEVVFLPYKASMWDSLESVWRAAKADPACDVYVIPIPYYDKNPDGSFGRKHYEGAEYPADVSVTDYGHYDLKERHPDVIFIHNPYDEYNLVTSVEPAYYSRNIREYTDKLVYIPYFVLEELNPDDKEAVKNISHFITQPGVVYADRTIVQSENIRRAYIEVLTECYGKDTEKTWKEKILGLGSPKIDKLVNTKAEDVEIPDEWKKIIYGPDGVKKKVFLYNTGVSGLLEHSEQYIRKMKNVFEIFKANQERTALLWRPHPLIEATISAMRPQLWTEYKQLADRYREAGWGIYDDTADLSRALAVSDAYYGDHSSLVKLCLQAGKPIMIQDVEIVELERTDGRQ